MISDINSIEPEGFPIVSKAMREVLDEVRAFSYHQRSCIFHGPTGSGKEFIAKFYYKLFSMHSKTEPPYFSFNCSKLTSELARSELFGHVKGAFTGALYDKPGLFELCADGVLFLDELGDFPQDIQAILLRALNNESLEGMRLGSAEVYTVDNITIIGATDQDLTRLRPALLHRFSKVINIPGVEQRKEDIKGAVEYFAHRSLRKRKDFHQLMTELFGSEEDYPQAEFKGLRPSEYLAQRIANILLPEIEGREWSGHFREINAAVDNSIIMGFNTRNINSFVNEIHRYYAHNYNPDNINQLFPIADLFKERVRGAKPEEDLSKQILEALPTVSKEERAIWNKLLSALDTDFFMRQDIDALFPNIGERSLQNRLNQLIDYGLLMRSGSKGEVYQRKLLDQEVDQSLYSHFLPTNVDHCRVGWEQVAEDAADTLKKTRCMHLSLGTTEEPTELVQCAAEYLKRLGVVFYYHIDHSGLGPLITLFENELRERGILSSGSIPDFDNVSLKRRALSLSGYIDHYLKPAIKPILVLDNVDSLRSHEDIELLNLMLEYWTSFAFLLSGKKLNNAIQQGEELGLVERRV